MALQAINWVSLAMRSNGKYLEAMSSLIAIAMERAGAVDTLMRSEASRGSERLRSAMLDSITHEFRRPLTSIKASVTKN